MPGAELVMPTAAKVKAQMTSKDIAKTKRVSVVLIHVEPVILKHKTSSILSKVIPIASLRTVGFDDVLTVCCAIIKMQTSIVKHWMRHQLDYNLRLHLCNCNFIFIYYIF